ncbi:MAG: hypothetical protein KKF56_03420 [Nanoarchaeota archaeon]|nr:hypothetical protein [Nanoarchaeota archaeon]
MGEIKSRSALDIPQPPPMSKNESMSTRMWREYRMVHPLPEPEYRPKISDDSKQVKD